MPFDKKNFVLRPKEKAFFKESPRGLSLKKTCLKPFPSQVLPWSFRRFPVLSGLGSRKALRP
jgi:hypothetical protein